MHSVIFLFLSVLLINACALHKNPSVFVDIYRSSYKPGIDPANYKDFNGKTIVFYSIGIDAKNTTMLGYYSTDRNVRYTTNYEPGKMPQPIESFLWYTLQKSFTGAGITATNENISGSPLNIHLIFTSFDDREAKFQMRLLREGRLLIQKDIIVTQTMPSTTDVAELEKRAYAYFDSIAVAILSHPDFKKEILTPPDKPTTNNVTK
jgi:hypothetical protein